ncbi:DUF6879 family protein [Actinomadura macrotermitis]|uniref:DUF6879 domain-containing protein n=1 Tax=Actinomadura macrotermitis TaxID=2585200 RepID=A0A7K0BUM2_9ACTN|nr:DUF6879 family protein [Actinomadura macrotermitis]MQY04756.1 hypothetical protein [Actinomadura macrotermitis]
MDFVGMDDDSPKNQCPAVFVDPGTGDAYYQGRLVTDPGTLMKIAEHSPISADEAVVWHPASMGKYVLEALTGTYEPGRQGKGEPTFEALLAGAERSVVHLEARDTYDTTDPAFIEWRRTGDTSYEWDDWIELVGGVVARGVRFRRLRIVSEPVSDYIRWEHAISYGNIRAGEELRWLPRRLAYDLMTPVADYFMFDQRVIRYNFTAGDGTGLDVYEHVTDPRAIIPVVGVFEMLWERAVPHADYTPS